MLALLAGGKGFIFSVLPLPTTLASHAQKFGLTRLKSLGVVREAFLSGAVQMTSKLITSVALFHRPLY